MPAGPSSVKTAQLEGRRLESGIFGYFFYFIFFLESAISVAQSLLSEEQGAAAQHGENTDF